MNPEKCQIWTWWFAGCMFIIEKNSWTKDKGNLDPPSILVISPSKPLNFLGDGSIYERRAWRHKDNILKFLPGHGEAIPWHHARRHVFQAFIHILYSCYPVKDAFMVDYCHTFPRNICPFLVRHENLLNGTSIVFQTILVHPFIHRLFELELCALMPRKCT